MTTTDEALHAKQLTIGRQPTTDNRNNRSTTVNMTDDHQITTHLSSTVARFHIIQLTTITRRSNRPSNAPDTHNVRRSLTNHLPTVSSSSTTDRELTSLLVNTTTFVRRPDTTPCYNCGGKCHIRQLCSANNITCFLCGRNGHFQTVCLSAHQ